MFDSLRIYDLKTVMCVHALYIYIVCDLNLVIGLFLAWATVNVCISVLDKNKCI